MPALITHHLFGEEAMQELPLSVFANKEHELAFLLANQGPDPFFFRFLGLPDSVVKCQKMGTRMHDELIAEAFQALRDAVLDLPEEDQSLGRAFALGLLSHYTLDRVAHPYVYGIQYELMDIDKKNLGNADSEVHAVVESALDSWMLMKKRHKTVNECPPYKELETTERINRVAGALFSQVAWQVFGIDLGANEYGAALKNMTTVYKIIEPAGSFRGKAAGLLEEKVRDNYSLIQSLAHEIVDEKDTSLANMKHLSWENPWTKRAECDSFLDRFKEGLADYPRMVAAFTRGGKELREAVCDLNYSGKLDEAKAHKKANASA